MTLAMLIQTYIKYLSYQCNYSRETITHYRSLLYRLNSFLSKDKSPLVTEIRSIHLRRFLTDIAQNGVKPTTILHYIEELSAFYSYVVAEGYMEENPVKNIKKPNVPERLPIYLSVRELAQLFNVVNLEDKYGLRDLTILKTLYYTGLRVGELANLKAGNIREEFSYLAVLKGKGDRDRLVPIHQHLKGILIRYCNNYQIKDSEEALFKGKTKMGLSRNYISSLVKSYAIKAGLNPGFRSHTLRHTFATHLYQQGVDINTISELLGHSKLETTRIYTHMSTNRLTKIIQKI